MTDSNRESDRYLLNRLEQNDELDFDTTVSAMASEFDVSEKTAASYVYKSEEVSHTWEGDEHYIVEETDAASVAGEAAQLVGEVTGETYERLAVLKDIDHPLVPDDETYFQRRLIGHKTDAQLVAHSMSADTPKGALYPLLVGMPGVGKNHLFRHLAAKTNRPLIRIPCDESIRYEDVVGHYAPTEDGGFKWRDGLLTTAMRIGGLVVFDEVNMMEGDVSAAVHQATESNPQLVIRETGEVVEPHPQYRVGATMNPTGFAGTKQMNAAFEDRFDPFEIPHLDREGEKHVVFQNVPAMQDKEDDLDDLLDFAGKCRELYPRMLSVPVTPRKVMAMCDYLADGFLGPEEAVLKVLQPLVDEEEKNALNDALETL